jgi:hypothetical protein
VISSLSENPMQSWKVNAGRSCGILRDGVGVSEFRDRSINVWNRLGDAYRWMPPMRPAAAFSHASR